MCKTSSGNGNNFLLILPKSEPKKSVGKEGGKISVQLAGASFEMLTD
jgi:hypothetical protein